MKYLLMACAMLTLLATGCGDDAVVQENPALKKVEINEVDKDTLTSVMASNELTLVDFTATW